MNIQETTTHRNVTNKNDIKFMEKFNLLKEFKEEFGRFPKTTEKYKGVKLGMWCSTVRNKKWRQSKDRIAMLDSIGFIWCVHDYKWDKNFKLLKEFKEEYDRFPISGEIYKGTKLGMWCDIQRHYYNNDRDCISEDRIAMLDSIGFIWSIHAYQWDKNFELLKEFKEEYGRMPSSNEDYKDVHLGMWCANVRYTYKVYNNLSEDLYIKLKEIGFMFDCINENFMQRVELLKEFKEEKGRLPKQYERYKDVELGFWMYNNMSRCKDEEKKELLRSIGVNI